MQLTLLFAQVCFVGSGTWPVITDNHIPWEVPIVVGRSVCRTCGFIVSGTRCDHYGCSTLDAVVHIISIIEKKAKQTNNKDGSFCHPFMLVQCDQFGIAHAPFAQGRAFLTERGYGDCKVLILQQVEGITEEEESCDGTKYKIHK